MTEAAVHIGGLREFARGLRRMDAEMPKALRIALNEAADVVVTEVRRDIPRRSGRAADSVKPRSTRTAVRVAAGGKRAPYFPWLDYGGRVGRRKTTKRPFIKEGRYLYPGYFRAKADGRFVAALERALVGVARSAGVEVS